MRNGLRICFTLVAAVMIVFVFTWNREVFPEDVCGLSGPLAGDDLRVVQFLRQHYLDPPSTLPYNLSKVNSSRGTHSLSWSWIRSHLDIIFGGEHGGFFIEAGALDGQYLSNTLWLERKLNWTGLLIEPDPGSYNALQGKHRKSWSSNTCLSSENYPRKTTFVSRFVKWPSNYSPWVFRGHSHELRQDVLQNYSDNQYEEKKNSSVQCFPLLTYMKALNVSQVDLLALDVQGSELGIIKTLLNQNAFTVRVIIAEDDYYEFDYNVLDVIQRNGYKLFAMSGDIIFIRNGDPIFQKQIVKDFMKTRKLGNSDLFKYEED